MTNSKEINHTPYWHTSRSLPPQQYPLCHGSFLQHGVVWYRDQASEATGCRPNHRLRPSPWVTFGICWKKTDGGLHLPARLQRTWGICCVFQPVIVLKANLWTQQQNVVQAGFFGSYEWCRFRIRWVSGKTASPRGLCEPVKHHWVTVLLKALEETPMLSRAAQKGVSTWVVRQLSHVITALPVSVTPIT